MICRKCNGICPEEAKFCSWCGAELEPVNGLEIDNGKAEMPQAACPPVQMAQPAPAAPEKGRAWVPLAVMAGMFLLGLLGFLLLRAGNSPQETGSIWEPFAHAEWNISRQSQECPWFMMDENGYVTYVEEYDTGDGVVIVPETLDGNPVRGVAVRGFAGSEVIAVILPDTVEEVRRGAFADCESLRGVYLGGHAAQIGADAFLNCTALESVWVPDSVNAIGRDAFLNCSRLRFVFYSGDYVTWERMYGDFISPFTYIICPDGSHRQGVPQP